MDETGDKDPILEKLVELMWEAQNQKTAADAGSVARRWAVFYTELEKILAYYQAMLKSKPEGE